MVPTHTHITWMGCRIHLFRTSKQRIIHTSTEEILASASSLDSKDSPAPVPVEFPLSSPRPPTALYCISSTEQGAEQSVSNGEQWGQGTQLELFTRGVVNVNGGSTLWLSDTTEDVSAQTRWKETE